MALRRFRFLLLTLAAGSAAAAELVPFAPPWDDTAPGPTDLRATLPAPAGAAGFVHVANGQLRVGADRLKLFGVNFTAGACFPDRATADRVAGRLAKFGLNAARFHFLDATWGQPQLIRYESGDWTQWDADALDRFDYFFHRLKAQGIYANLNLLVGRRFGVGDGVDPAIQSLDWKTAHAVGFFHAPLREAQKAYARRLLTHRNPHTGLTYAEDPALALVELNNENGLLHAWLGGELDALPEPFAADLRRQWNRWLALRYPDPSALARAWGARKEAWGAERLRNADFALGLQEWNVERHHGARVDAAVEAGEAVLRVRQTGSESWHVQFNQARLPVRQGELYTVRFRAVADRERPVRVSLMMARDPWRELGLSARLSLTREPQSFSFTFVATADAEEARLNFGELNQDGAEYRFGGLSLRPGGRLGLEEGESLERGNLRLPTVSAAHPLPAGGHRDWIRFLWETERAYWRALRHCLRDELGVRAPLVGTIVATSTPHLMAEFDAVDTHAYWEHPRFPGRAWDRHHWRVGNRSMVDDPERATVNALAFQRVEGRPHLVSEYNHPAPNPHAGEAPLFLALFGALQDWDALFLYTWSHDDTKTKAGRIPDFFDLGQHPTQVANLPAASLLFRRGDLAPARQVLRLPLPVEQEIRRVAESGRAWSVLPPAGHGLDLRLALRHRIVLDLTGAAPPPAAPPPPLAAPFQSDTEELVWSLPSDGQGLLTFRSDRTKGFLGHADGQTLDLGHGVQVSLGSTRTGWCTWVLTLLEGDSFGNRPRRALLAATGYTENTDMGWQDEARTTVGADWGRAPSLVEVVPATLRVPRGATPPVLYPLDARGQRLAGQVGAGDRPGEARFSLGPPAATLWYELVWPDPAAAPGARPTTANPDRARRPYH
jgi:hypothetical protein